MFQGDEEKYLLMVFVHADKLSQLWDEYLLTDEESLAETASMDKIRAVADVLCESTKAYSDWKWEAQRKEAAQSQPEDGGEPEMHCVELTTDAGNVGTVQLSRDAEPETIEALKQLIDAATKWTEEAGDE